MVSVLGAAEREREKTAARSAARRGEGKEARSNVSTHFLLLRVYVKSCRAGSLAIIDLLLPGDLRQKPNRERAHTHPFKPSNALLKSKQHSAYPPA
jgi:hypothetical protein